MCYSVGVIYAVVLNLPRHLRYKLQNVCLIGIIYDMGKEPPPPPVNTFIEPLVSELMTAWKDGIHCLNSVVRFKLALMCVGCDVPATKETVRDFRSCSHTW